MSESSTATVRHTEPFNWFAGLYWPALIIATLYVCYFSHLGAVGLVGPDEPRYAWIARAMAESGDWVTPRLYDQPWFEKPPLYYWGAALSFELFGVNEAAARLPSAVAALLGTLALAWLAWKIYGGKTARWLLLLLPTTVGMIGFSHAAATDMPFSGMLTMAMVAAAVLLGLRSAEREANISLVFQPQWKLTLARISFGVALALAVLAKGPAALILCGGTIFFWSLVTKRWRDSLRLLHPLAVAAFLIAAVPWYLICQQQNRDFFRIFILEHNFQRYLTPQFQHVQPFWFYLPIVAAAWLPWTTLVAWSIWQGLAKLRQTKRISDSSVFFLSWTLFCIAFFSLSQSKLPGYILPALLPLALLVAQSYTVIEERSKAFQLIHLLAALLLAMLFTGLEVAAPHVSRKGIEFGMAVGFIVAAISSANLILGGASAAGKFGRVRELAATLSVVPILLVLLFSNRLTASLFNGDPSGKRIATDLQALRIPEERLFISGLNRGEHYGLNFYLHQEVPEWDEHTPAWGYVVAKSKRCGALVPTGWSCEEIPLGTQIRDRSVYRINRAGSLPGAAGGGKFQ